MSEEVTLQDKLQAAIEADAKGIPVDWKAMCVETYNVAMAEIQRLQSADMEAASSADSAAPDETD